MLHPTPNVTCSFQDVISCNCDFSPSDANGSLNVTVQVHDRPLLGGHGPPCLRNLTMSMKPTALWLTGDPSDVVMQWMFSNGNWSSLKAFHLVGFMESTFNVSSLIDPQHGGALELSVLDLHDNFLTTILNPQQPLKSLQMLDASNNYLTEIPAVLLMWAPGLMSLDLHGNLLTAVRGGDMPLKVLECVNLSHNHITAVQDGSLGFLVSLLELDMSDNQLAAFPSGICMQTPNLMKLDFSRNQITSVPNGTLPTCEGRLSSVNLARNAITELKPHTFPVWLHELFLDHNAITSMATTAIQPNGNLYTLTLHHNNITCLARGFFVSFFKVTSLDLSFNAITSLPANASLGGDYLLELDLSHNKITRVDGIITYALETLDLSFNRITRARVWSLDSPRSLGSLDLSDNPISSITNLPPALTALYARNHEIGLLDLSQLVSLPYLTTLDLDTHPGVGSVATLDDHWDMSRLTTLRLANVMVPQELLDKMKNTSMQLTSLHLGWPGLDEHALANNALCDLMANEAHDLMVVNTTYTTLTLCHRAHLHTLSLQDNRQLTRVSVSHGAHQLNVSNCPQLHELSVPSVNEIDFSNTSLPPTPELCSTIGTDVVLARNLRSPQFGDNNDTRLVLQRCLPGSSIADFSDNLWLDSLALVQPVVGRVVLINASGSAPSLTGFPTRAYPQLLTLHNTPVTCTIMLTTIDLNVGYTFSCECARGYKLQQQDNAKCVREHPDFAMVAGVSAAGGAAFVLLVVLVSKCVLRAQLRRRQLLDENEAQRRRLRRQQAEVEALRGAWTIRFEELRLEKRLAAGAYGVVYKAEWDTVTVAVKVLRESMAMDEATRREVEAEAEFLQQTRHPHLVRFFGTGTDPSNNPFLVLEYVELGSLKHILQGDLEVLLRDHRTTRQHAVDDDDDDDDDDDADVGDEGDMQPLLVNGQPVVQAPDLVPDTVWELKVQLLRDVTSGMAFIHSKGHAHRDLKSANVLVSQRLRAKITDFGTIRHCLQPRVADGGADMSGRPDMTVGVGTPLYMAPEVLVGGAYDIGADVFSFGVLMWEVATQQQPDLVEQERPSYRGPFMSALVDLLHEGKRLSFQDRADIPPWFQDLALKCMAQNPRDRPTFDTLENGRLIVR
ncbi:TKL protein kinase [Salpingoeca rosetta]|uniref:non-specific serine/threonine protein kinase n=1 Tax=Salpingoeca rosetta (strain ATCC 50818 / BSB-021) TaxID=946362 RepID=F2UA17_SALR5|nr:TKL protein kinase [Salpingoeca rosetta]EGD73592.1 TKL protein kinase [Salpingoeca rosetta]|eukprot:XP_004993874.1 TKL protein kinase [Salpingoeca rosetta]